MRWNYISFPFCLAITNYLGINNDNINIFYNKKKKHNAKLFIKIISNKSFLAGFNAIFLKDFKVDKLAHLFNK